MNWWRASKRPEERAPELDPQRKLESETGPPQKQDRILALQRSVGNQAVQKLLPQNEGEPIAEETRQELEAAFGKDLSDVRVHRDQAAAELATGADANALTTGREIYFAAGGYNAGTLAHEVSHVIQQGQATSYLLGEDAALERQADTASSRVMSGRVAEVSRVTAVPGMQRQTVPGTQQSSLKLLPTYSLTLDSFDTDKFTLSSNHKEKLDDFAKRLKNTLSGAPDAIITIVGFADAPGTEPHNLGLGQQRANTVRDYLIGKGVPADVLHASSLGEQVPVVETKGHEALNRRVEIDVVERSSFKPSPVVTPPSLGQTPPVAPPKGIDLTYHPKIHEPTPSEEFQDKLRQIDKAVREAQEAERARPGTSAADVFGRVARDAAKKLGFPKWVQDRAESLAEDLPSKGVQAVFDQITGDKSLDANTQNAIKAMIDALMRMKVK